jgi:hypothetical protein
MMSRNIIFVVKYVNMIHTNECEHVMKLGLRVMNNLTSQN